MSTGVQSFPLFFKVLAFVGKPHPVERCRTRKVVFPELTLLSFGVHPRPLMSRKDGPE